MSNWYLLQYKPNSHDIAVKNLNRQGYKTFLPVQEVTRRTTTHFATKLTPLFPGYLFVQVDPLSAPWRRLNSTFGVSRLVQFGQSPKPVPTELITDLQSRCSSKGILLPPPSLSPGHTVEILMGPFTHFIAKVEEIAADQRVWLLLDLMGQTTRLQVQNSHVQLQ